MDISTKILSDIVIYNKYAKYNKYLKRRETFDEIIDRNLKMHIDKFKGNTELIKEINKAYKLVYDRKVLPSMRACQFAGRPIELMPSRQYNCFDINTEFMTKDGIKSFKDYKDGDNVTIRARRGWKPAKVKYFGKENITKLILRKGNRIKEIETTENHRWILDNNDILTTSELETDMKLKSFQKSTNLDIIEMCPIAIQHGIVFGDGTYNKENNSCSIRICGDSVNETSSFFFSKNKNKKTIVGLPSNFKNLPDLNMNKQYLYGFLAGWFLSDGSIGKTGSNITLSSSNYDYLKWARSAFSFLCITTSDINISRKINPFNNKESYLYRITIDRENLPEDFLLLDKHKNRFNSIKKEINWKVETIINTNTQKDVFCIVEPEFQEFTLANGVLTKNCAYLAANHPAIFSETMFLLLGGTGVGFSVQRHHVEKLPPVRKPPKGKTRRYVIADNINGWADAIKMLVKSYFNGKPEPRFDYSDIREKGSELITSGGKAPGPQPLKNCIHHLKSIFDSKDEGEQLSSLNVHDMMCHIADAVLAGGIRRAACISLFDLDDEDMLTCKFGNWWELNPQRGRANNSVMILRHKVKEEDFKKLWKKIQLSGCGEPGFCFTNDKETGGNPCFEIALKSEQFCNLSEVNISDVESQEDLNERVRAAATIGTLQASYTDFHYLRESWKKNTEKDALLGVSMTGIASGTFNNLNLTEAALIVNEQNEKIAKMIGINKASRTTCIKPSGTTSLVFGCSSGIHAYHSTYYLRRMRIGKDESIYKYLKDNCPNLVVDDLMNPKQGIIEIPIKAPNDAIIRTESPIELLERVKLFSEKWIRPGYRKGENNHNVSATISIKDNEWEEVGEWMWKNRNSYNGLSVLNYDGGSYFQAPFEDITEDEYNKRLLDLVQIDLSKIIEERDNTDLQGEQACSGGKCEIF